MASHIGRRKFLATLAARRPRGRSRHVHRRSDAGDRIPENVVRRV